MKAGSPSRTAQAVAIRRAEHQLFDFPHVLDDPVALRIIGRRAAASIMLRLPASQLPVARYLRAFVAARSRYAEDRLATAVASGTGQYVVLGAGLDTFAYRNPYPAGSLRVFEVDHPDTQAWKRRRLAETGIPVPADLTFVPVDFERQKLEVELEGAGFMPGERAFFSWLGVTPYLTSDVVLATLALIHSFCPDNAVAFDYALPRQGLSAPEKLAHDAIRATVVRAGEPFRSFFSPDTLVDALTATGYRQVESLTTDEINARYFRNRLDGLQVRGRLGGLMCAA